MSDGDGMDYDYKKVEEALQNDPGLWNWYYESTKDPEMKELIFINRIDFLVYELSKGFMNETISRVIENFRAIQSEVESRRNARNAAKWEKKFRLDYLRHNRFVYVAENDGHFKVGISANILRRERELQKLSRGARITIVWRGTYKDEKAAHDHLSSFNIFGEWFKKTDESIAALVDFLKRNSIHAEVLSA